jgi:adenylosuccinate synthase
MIRHIAVIGANFGDEGKGQMVNHLAQNGKFQYQTVVRFNGGSQAGHTVVLPNGKLHIFSQLGSGSFVGLPTHLSRFMYLNPIYLVRELEVFHQETGKYPSISVDPRANIVFHSDVRTNQLEEASRGESRHGSTGHGIFNAVIRGFNASNFSRADHFFRGDARNIIHAAREVDAYYSNEQSKLWIDEFYRAIGFLNNLENFTLEKDDDIVNNGSCIFEGAQGLLLDQNSGFFPHVTPSNTGLTNIISLLSGSSEYILTPVYVTRSFLTRHGNGPMYYNEFDSLFNYDIDAKELVDETNVPNPWQGSMRYGKLSIDQLRRTINIDFNRAIQQKGYRIKIEPPRLAITWANLRSQDDIIEKIREEFFVEYMSFSNRSVVSVND